MDDDQPATAETIIHALSQFGNVDQDQDQDHHANDYDHLLPEHVTEELELEQEDELGGLGGMSRGELEAEVLKLRGMVYDTRTPTSSTMMSSQSRQGQALGSGSEESRMVKRRRLDSKEIDITVGRDLQTGKRVEKGRRTELGKAIRCHMREMMGMISEKEKLPSPRVMEDSSMSTLSSTPGHEQGEVKIWRVPDWEAPIGDKSNMRWMNEISTNLFQILVSPENPYNKVEEGDKELSIIQEAVRVTFANYVKRWKSENDTVHAERKAKYAKNRRRWARKDLKQEKRRKAQSTLSPNDTYADIPSEALLFEYMSSEYSSSGSDSEDDQPELGKGGLALGVESSIDGQKGRDGGAVEEECHQHKVRRRKEIWSKMRNIDPTADQGGSGLGDRVESDNGREAPNGETKGKAKTYGWASGLTTKVLEVRTPSWRSERLNAYYAHLDSISDTHAQERNTPRTSSMSNASAGGQASARGIKPGHVAPSHSRFTLHIDIRRRGSMGKGRKKKQGKREAADEDGWMWATGRVGVWPSRTRSAQLTSVEGPILGTIA